MWAAWGWGRRPPICTKKKALFILRCLAQALATGFHRFLVRFSGRRRLRGPFYCHKNPPPWTVLVVVVASLFSIVDACSSRTTPKPRPPAPTTRPNITFHTYECPPAYAAWYCLNGATCFTVKLGDSLLYNCVCAEGYMGLRCEYKDLDGSYLPSQRRLMLETASIAGGAAIAVLVMLILCLVLYVRYKRKAKALSRTASDCVDGRGGGSGAIRTPTFGTRWRTSPPVDLPIRVLQGGQNSAGGNGKHGKVELHQVTTLLPAADQP